MLFRSVKPAFAYSGLCVLHRKKLGKLHISLCSLFFSLKTDFSFPLVANIFIEKAKSENFSYHFSLHFRNFQYIIAVNLERKIDKQYQLKIYFNLPKKALEP